MFLQSLKYSECCELLYSFSFRKCSCIYSACFCILFLAYTSIFKYISYVHFVSIVYGSKRIILKFIFIYCFLSLLGNSLAFVSIVSPMAALSAESVLQDLLFFFPSEYIKSLHFVVVSLLSFLHSTGMPSPYSKCHFISCCSYFV